MPQADRRRSRSRSRQNGGRRALEQQLQAFRRRYPADDRAFEFLEKSHPKVVEQVLADFAPPRENQEDYSALLTNFIRQVRDRLRVHAKRWKRQYPQDQQNEEPSDPGPEVEEAVQEDAASDPRPDGGGTHFGLRQMVAEVGASLGRPAEDCEPFTGLLEDNWYDTIESLEDVTAQDLAAVGLPLRFAKELVNVVGMHLAKGRAPKASSMNMPPATYIAQDERSAGKGSANKGEKGKGKGKGKGKSKSRDMAEREFTHTIPVPLSGYRSEDLKSLGIRITGEHGKHFKYIRDRARVEVWLEGEGSGHRDQGTGEESRGALCVRLRSDSRNRLEYAVELVEDLLGMVLKEGRRHRS
mmetsp:Transcript_55781/g.129919  ORF Transcript_55781/g.129919 Transcript_55781/m.129919 type:complete len:355 (+) Transcript_55781:102-1166(+)